VANLTCVRYIKQGVSIWNSWKKVHADTDLSNIDLTGACLPGIDLEGADLVGTDFTEANLNGSSLYEARLTRAILHNTDLSQSDMRGSDLSDAELVGADLTRCDLDGSVVRNTKFSGAMMQHASLRHAKTQNVDLSGANLQHAKLSGISLRGADLTNCSFGDTLFLDVDLASARGLDTCSHQGPSGVDFLTLRKSDPLPLNFLRGVGLPDNVIDYLPSLLSRPIEHYSCFISYSSFDQEFANRIHADLQNRGVRCWYAPHDMPIGGKILDEIDSAIRLRDKLLLIISEHSLESDWVEDEVTRAFEEERDREQLVLFPIRLDDAVMETKEAWASKLRAQRHIGDFRRWKEHDEYQKSFERVLRDLAVKKP